MNKSSRLTTADETSDGRVENANQPPSPAGFQAGVRGICRKGATEAKHARLHFDGVGFRATQDRRLHRKVAEIPAREAGREETATAVIRIVRNT